MTKLHITYTPRLDATPEAEANTLASVYCFILFEPHTGKEGGPDNRPEDAERIPSDGAKTILHD